MRPELEAAVRAVEACGTSRHAVTRHLVRPVLLQLGQCLAEGRDAEADEAVSRLGRLSDELRESFGAAVADELEMACTEHIRSVDPRYLLRPDYDLAYTVTARDRLEARLRAAERLGLPADPSTLEHVRRADARLRSRQGDRHRER